jgi:molybdate transport system ATP-binding protein
MMLSLDLCHTTGAFTLEAKVEAAAGITVLFGPSGSGKTSLINAVAGLIQPDRGRVVVKGRVLVDTQAGICLPPWQRSVGLVFQEARLFPHLDVRANLLYGRRWSADPASAAEVARLVDLLDLGHLLTRRPRHLSGGERSRVALGRALVARPDVAAATVIDEYVELAKAFFDDAEAKFVNAALDGVARDVRPKA